jgi:outer membrane protein OmpA-like peptidoglycan-associated protein
MNIAVRIAGVLVLATLLLPGAALAAPKVDPEAARFAAELAALDADPALSGLAGVARLQAQQALVRLQQARSHDRPQALLIVSRRVEAAVAAANAELLEQQSAQLDRERDQIMIEAARLEAIRSRREAEMLRMQTLAREEETERLAEAGRVATEQSEAEAEAANAEAAQANRLAAARAREVELARKEAELAAAVADAGGRNDAGKGDDSGNVAAPSSRRSGGRTVYTLDGQAFPSGSAQLTSRAIASLRQLAAEVPAGASLQIEGHTDAQGADDANRLLSQRRADAVRRALAAAGIAASRLRAVGKGEADPVAENTTEAGRARNRRVEITVQ